MNKQIRRGVSIRIFLADGLPDGLRVVEKSNWTGRAVVCPRSRFPEAKSRPEFERTGVYVLRGPSEAGDLPTLYVGEGDPTLPRLEQHFAWRTPRLTKPSLLTKCAKSSNGWELSRAPRST